MATDTTGPAATPFAFVEQAQHAVTIGEHPGDLGLLGAFDFDEADRRPDRSASSTGEDLARAPEEPTPAYAPDWHDDFPSSHLGEAEPEDELPLISDVDAVAADHLADALTRTTSQLLTPEAARVQAERVAEIAERLERIARTLRDEGSTAPLIERGTDPLGALITGYLLGFFEGSGARKPPPSG